MEGVYSRNSPSLLFLHHSMGTIHHFLSLKRGLDGLEGKRNTIKKKKTWQGLSSTSCFLMDLKSNISLGSNKDYSTVSATYPALPCWKSRLEASLERGALSSSRDGAQVGATAQWLTFLSPSLANLVCIPLGCLASL